MNSIIKKAITDYQNAAKLQDEVGKKLNYETSVSDAKYYLSFVLESKRCAEQLIIVDISENVKQLANNYIKASVNLINCLSDFIKKNSKNLPN